jgi:hypothetical protein
MSRESGVVRFVHAGKGARDLLVTRHQIESSRPQGGNRP